MRPVRLGADSAPVGTIAGAALGGLLGNSIGHGGGRSAATIIGAVGGGIAGNAIERNVSAEKAFVAGFLSTLVFHQGLLAILHAVGVPK